MTYLAQVWVRGKDLWVTRQHFLDCPPDDPYEDEKEEKDSIRDAA
jgi:hypothetical protein